MPESLGRAWEPGGALHMAPPTQTPWEGAAQSVNLLCLHMLLSAWVCGQGKGRSPRGQTETSRLRVASL